MEYLWPPVILAVGALVGFLHRGREDSWGIVRRGLLIGLLLALVIAGLGLLAGASTFGLQGAGAALLNVVALTGLFVIGAWLGDLLETRLRRES